MFDRLHSRAHDGEVFLYAFDLQELHDEDWRPRPLEARKDRLAKLMANAPAGLQFTEHLEGDGAVIFLGMPASSGLRGNVKVAWCFSQAAYSAAALFPPSPSASCIFSIAAISLANRASVIPGLSLAKLVHRSLICCKATRCSSLVASWLAS
jgi:hypothetical protein